MKLRETPVCSSDSYLLDAPFRAHLSVAKAYQIGRLVRYYLQRARNNQRAPMDFSALMSSIQEAERHLGIVRRMASDLRMVRLGVITEDAIRDLEYELAKLTANKGRGPAQSGV